LTPPRPSRHAPVPAAADESAAILQHWREAVPHDRLAHLVKDATRAFVRALSERLVVHGVSFGHWQFLRILWEADGLTQKALSVQAGVMEPTTFAAVTAMERAGYVERRHLPGNRKSVHVYLTRKGRALKRKLVPLAEDVNAIGVAGVSAKNVAITRTVLLAIIANLAAADEPVRDAAATASQPSPAARRRKLSPVE
jgi:DNA-binding MarR family transcriptional regulator